MNLVPHREPPKLPATQSDLLALRRIKEKLSLNNRIEEIVKGLWEEPKYLLLIKAIYDEQAVEGSLGVDNVLVAELIRDYAKQHGITDVADAKLATIVKCHNTVLRRYGLDRKTRRNEVGG